MMVALTLPLVAALVALAALVVGPRVLPYRALHVRSGSMAPALPMGSLAVFVPADAEALEAGDVIVFERDAHLVTHRIVAVEQRPDGTSFLTKGDANNAADAEVVPATGQGWRLAWSVAQAGWLVERLQSLASDRTVRLGVGTGLAVMLLAELWWPRPSPAKRPDPARRRR